MITAQRLISQARLWNGTPYHDQAHTRGVGCDCVGLFVGLGSELGIWLISDDEYPVEPTGEEMLSFLQLNCTPTGARSLDETTPADIVAMTMRSTPGPHHLVLRSEHGIIHAFGDMVREEPLFGRQRFHSAWRHKEVLPWPVQSRRAQ